MYITAHGPVSEMTYTVSSGMLNSSIPYRSIILSPNKIQNRDILVPANPGPPGKWLLKWEKEICIEVVTNAKASLFQRFFWSRILKAFICEIWEVTFGTLQSYDIVMLCKNTNASAIVNDQIAKVSVLWQHCLVTIAVPGVIVYGDLWEIWLSQL